MFKYANKGFTLVELIVVIVILAILVGVTIGGIYMYVGKAKENTDKKNFAEIARIIETANADETTMNVICSSAEANKNKTVVLEWNTDQADAGNIYGLAYHQVEVTGERAIRDYMAKCFPDGIKKSALGKTVVCVIRLNENGTGIKKVYCMYEDDMRTQYPDFFTNNPLTTY